MIQGNYKQNDENELLLVSETEDVVLFRHERDEEGNYPVVEATFAKNDDTYMNTVEKMCGEVGITLDEGLEYIEISEVMYAYDLEEYLNNHPDIKGIEYQGKIMNADELEESWSAGFEAVYADEEGETESAS